MLDIDEKEFKKNGWNEWSNYVRLTLKSLDKKADETNKTVIQLQIQIATMQKEMEIKAAERGAWSGGIIALIVNIVGGIIIFELLN
jgi:hypothetical protein